MLKAQELRIGNLVSQNGFFGYVYSIESALPRQEERFSDKDLVTLFDNGITTVPIEEIKPIELTEDWLIDNGFYAVEVDSGEYYYQNCRFRLNSNYAGFYYSRNLTVKYVHQLQNLYFALTGVELREVK